MKPLKVIIFLLISLFPFSLLQSQIETKNETDHPKWRLGVSGGMSYRIGSTKEAQNSLINAGLSPKLADDYMSDFKWGTMAGVDCQYFFKPNLGIGMKYLFYSNSAQLDEKVSLLFGDGVSLLYGRMKDQVYLNYVGPAFAIREFIGNKQDWAFSSLLSVGYLHYREETLIADAPLLWTGSTVGFHGAVGIEYYFSPNIALGLDLTCLSAFLSKAKVTDGVSTQTVDLGDRKESLSHLDLGLNLKFYF